MRLCALLFQLDRFIPISKLKYYFAVDTVYVGKKLGLLVFPYMHEVGLLTPAKCTPVRSGSFPHQEVILCMCEFADSSPWASEVLLICRKKYLLLIMHELAVVQTSFFTCTQQSLRPYSSCFLSLYLDPHINKKCLKRPSFLLCVESHQ